MMCVDLPIAGTTFSRWWLVLEGLLLHSKYIHSSVYSTSHTKGTTPHCTALHKEELAQLLSHSDIIRPSSNSPRSAQAPNPNPNPKFPPYHQAREIPHLPHQQTQVRSGTPPDLLRPYREKSPASPLPNGQIRPLAALQSRVCPRQVFGKIV